MKIRVMEMLFHYVALVGIFRCNAASAMSPMDLLTSTLHRFADLWPFQLSNINNGNASHDEEVNSHNGTVSVGPSRNSWGKLLDENGIISEERNVSEQYPELLEIGTEPPSPEDMELLQPSLLDTDVKEKTLISGTQGFPDVSVSPTVGAHDVHIVLTQEGGAIPGVVVTQGATNASMESHEQPVASSEDDPTNISQDLLDVAGNTGLYSARDVSNALQGTEISDLPALGHSVTSDVEDRRFVPVSQESATGQSNESIIEPRIRKRLEGQVTESFGPVSSEVPIILPSHRVSNEVERREPINTGSMLEVYRNSARVETVTEPAAIQAVPEPASEASGNRRPYTINARSDATENEAPVIGSVRLTPEYELVSPYNTSPRGVETAFTSDMLNDLEVFE